MRLSARILQNATDVNNFGYTQQAEFTQGDTPTIYFQLIDSSLDRPDQGFVPSGRRYMPAVGASLVVTLDHLDDTRKITRAAFQPFSSDPSIWAITILSTDVLRGTVNMKLALVEGSKPTNGLLQAALNVTALDGMTYSGRNGGAAWGF